MLAKLLLTIRTSTHQVTSAIRSRWNRARNALVERLQRMSAFVRSLPVRVLIVLLEILRRITLSRPFRWVLMPVIYVRLIVYVLRLAAG